jgi:hypothetical protein
LASAEGELMVQGSVLLQRLPLHPVQIELEQWRFESVKWKSRFLQGEVHIKYQPVKFDGSLL